MFRHAALLALVVFVPLRAAAASSFEDTVELERASISVAAAKAAVQTPARVDLSGQFPDPPRLQGDMGSCHSFVAVALIEAAYFRQYGSHLRLSEADLFVRRNALPALPYLRSRETGTLRPDVAYALANGVMPGDFYAAFEARYHAWKRRFFKFLDPKSSVLQELLPESATPEAIAAREKVRSEIAGFKPGNESFLKFIGATARSAIDRNGVHCKERRVEKLILRQLLAGRPVGIGLSSGWTNSPEWRRGANGPGGWHYFVITGYDNGITGAPVFHTRNTWSAAEGGSPDLAGEDLCQVFAVSWVRAPVDEK